MHALCCPRELDLQINLVRTIAVKLKALGYTIAPPGTARDKWPDLEGLYKSNRDTPLRDAIRHYAKANNVTLKDDHISYEFVDKLLGRDLFERWKTR
jgi:hypothetical protein